MSAHTPGPWRVGGPFPSVSVCIEAEPGDSETPPIWEPVCIVDSNTSLPQNERSLADARLIAAAPDLLALLVDFERVAAMDFSVNRNDSLLDLASRARGLISKVSP